MVAALGGSVEGGAARTGAYRRETLAAWFGDMALPVRHVGTDRVESKDILLMPPAH